MLLEVPIPIDGAAKERRAIASSLQLAEEQYRSGNYLSCVGSCRTAIEELWTYRYQCRQWGSTLEPLASHATRLEVDKQEREAAVYAVLRHYTNQAHHGPAEGGVSEYTQAEAHLVLSLTAAAATHAHVR